MIAKYASLLVYTNADVERDLSMCKICKMRCTVSISRMHSLQNSDVNRLLPTVKPDTDPDHNPNPVANLSLP